MGSNTVVDVIRCACGAAADRRLTRCGACWQRDGAGMRAEWRRLAALKAAYGLAGFTPADIWAADRFGGHPALARLKREYPWPPAPGTVLARYGAARPRYGQA